MRKFVRVHESLLKIRQVFGGWRFPTIEPSNLFYLLSFSTTYIIKIVLFHVQNLLVFSLGAPFFRTRESKTLRSGLAVTRLTAVLSQLWRIDKRVFNIAFVLSCTRTNIFVTASLPHKKFARVVQAQLTYHF